MSSEKLSTKCQELIAQVVILKTIQNKTIDDKKTIKFALLSGFIIFSRAINTDYHNIIWACVKNLLIYNFFFFALTVDCRANLRYSSVT